MELQGKKLLILGGAYQHRKLVQAAKKMDIVTYVTDYLPFSESPAKQMADHGYMYNITDIDEIIALCKAEKIDGVIAPYLDVTQRPYQIICEKMGYPCFGDAGQFSLLTDKAVFKDFCRKNGADVIPDYRPEEVLCEREDAKAEFPILVKPCDSRGSRGQTICFDRGQVQDAVEQARKESASGKVILEKYMGTAEDIQLVYFIVDGEPILVRVEKRYLGPAGSGLDKLCIATLDPASCEEKFRRYANDRIVAMLKKTGIQNGPIFIQAFFDGKTAWLYDPGLRMPGDDYDVAYKAITGIDMAALLIEFALTGEIKRGTAARIREARLDKPAVMLLPAVRPGRIASIAGVEEIAQHPNVLTFSQAYQVGDVVGLHNNVKQRFGEFVLMTDTMEEMKKTIRWVFDTLQVQDAEGQDMLFARFDVNRLQPG